MKMVILFGLVLGALSAAGKVFFAEVKTKVTLECGVSKDHKRLEWLKGKELIWRHAKMPTKGGNDLASRSKLKNVDLDIYSVEEIDAGQFDCVVDGQRSHHFLIVVSVSVDPSGTLLFGTRATLECLVKEDPGTTASVQWRKPDGSVHPNGKVVLKSVALSDKGTWQCKVSSNGKTFEKNVTINVNVPRPTTPAANGNQNSPDSKNGGDSSCVGCDEPGDQPHLLGLIWWVWVAIGAGSLVVIILIIVVVVMYKRNKRRKRKFLRMKKVQLSQNPKQYCQCVRQTAAPKPQQGRRREKPSALSLQPLLKD
ncbi:CD4-2 molecule, tandem duplicate 2 isoform X1 [Cyprinodon tularosa]|uniref:CD4-2 molecule, tandem duplicate 2 isoform X1 n=1 Tax=Cyprinodon tularosa TaxID=77115 RepID=UPI0018E228B0|nr:CD4-2 molecule, tandem duplicate 2 isoform X1 [Cyprinodon tularosa]